MRCSPTLSDEIQPDRATGLQGDREPGRPVVDSELHGPGRDFRAACGATCCRGEPDRRALCRWLRRGDQGGPARGAGNGGRDPAGRAHEIIEALGCDLTAVVVQVSWVPGGDAPRLRWHILGDVVPILRSGRQTRHGQPSVTRYRRTSAYRLPKAAARSTFTPSTISS